MLIIFDLDGTLIDSSRDLTISTNATRAHFGLEPLDEALVNSYVGNGAATLVRRAMGPDISEQRQSEALDYFLQFYRAHALEHTKLYSGVRDALEELAAARQILGVLTNKPERISRDILSGLGVASDLFRIYGGNTFAQKKPDPVGILTMSREAGLNLRETVMVGDSSVDVQTARNAQVPCWGVTWGLQPGSFAEWPPDVVVDTPAQLPVLARMASQTPVHLS